MSNLELRETLIALYRVEKRQKYMQVKSQLQMLCRTILTSPRLWILSRMHLQLLANLE